jgi:hypothetical protein
MNTICMGVQSWYTVQCSILHTWAIFFSSVKLRRVSEDILLRILSEAQGFQKFVQSGHCPINCIMIMLKKLTFFEKHLLWITIITVSKTLFYFRCEKEEDLAMIAAQQYYIEFGTDMNPDRYWCHVYSDDATFAIAKGKNVRQWVFNTFGRFLLFSLLVVGICAMYYYLIN